MLRVGNSAPAPILSPCMQLIPLHVSKRLFQLNSPPIYTARSDLAVWSALVVLLKLAMKLMNLIGFHTCTMAIFFISEISDNRQGTKFS